MRRSGDGERLSAQVTFAQVTFAQVSFAKVTSALHSSEHQLSPQDAAKRRAALCALDLVEDGMTLGLGTGSTAAAFVDVLAERVRHGLKIVGVPTSERTAAQASGLGIPLATLDDVPELDLTIDGADEFDAQLRLIKGGGGALLREKITATASKRMVVLADTSKEVARLGRFPLPIEVNRFGLAVTHAAILRTAAACGCTGDVLLRRNADGSDYMTDGGHLILDGHFGAISDPDGLAARLVAIPGVVEHGLFIGIACAVIRASVDDVTIIGHLEGP